MPPHDPGDEAVSLQMVRRIINAHISMVSEIGYEAFARADQKRMAEADAAKLALEGLSTTLEAAVVASKVKVSGRARSRARKRLLKAEEGK